MGIGTEVLIPFLFDVKQKVKQFWEKLKYRGYKYFPMYKVFRKYAI